MFMILFIFISFFALVSLWTGGEEENSFDRSYRQFRNSFWSVATGTPAYRQGF